MEGKRLEMSQPDVVFLGNGERGKKVLLGDGFCGERGNCKIKDQCQKDAVDSTGIDRRKDLGVNFCGSLEKFVDQSVFCRGLDKITQHFRVNGFRVLVGMSKEGNEGLEISVGWSFDIGYTIFFPQMDGDICAPQKQSELNLRESQDLAETAEKLRSDKHVLILHGGFQDSLDFIRHKIFPREQSSSGRISGFSLRGHIWAPPANIL